MPEYDVLSQGMCWLQKYQLLGDHDRQERYCKGSVDDCQLLGHEDMKQQV